ncbi:F-box protein CPR1-like [Impatiens glandulifera]|uniref:F-box protein CPR1-like n=1 Tax=Impatiens glandulifera TaxID=253017 RepID=UPI001FB17A41|nr:F-box protein CPR1-like [Impatiens glandulifera]
MKDAVKKVVTNGNGGRRRGIKRSHLRFHYDPSSYALNFEEDDQDGYCGNLVREESVNTKLSSSSSTMAPVLRKLFTKEMWEKKLDKHSSSLIHLHVSNSSMMKKMVQLSNEIIEEIFCRLPVKSLFRFRTLSKSCLFLISSPYFVKLHLKQSVKTKSNISLLQKHYDLYRVDLDSLQDGDVLQPVEINPIPSFGNYTLKILNYRLKCSCDGLLCMSNIHDNNNVFLWNPSIRKCIKLPYTFIDLANQVSIPITYCDYRIGYVNTNDDYNIVRIAYRGRCSMVDYEFKVYSLRSNSWHRLEKFLYVPDFFSFGDSIVGGALHWISIVKSEDLIVAFHLGTEKYRMLSHPEYRGPYYRLYLDNFEGCLSLTCYYKSFDVDVFLLKEYGEKNEYWSRLITLSYATFLQIHHPFKLVAYSKSRKKILLEMDYMRHVLYNVEQKLTVEIKVDRMGPIIKLHTFVESLVSLDVPAPGYMGSGVKSQPIIVEEPDEMNALE